MSAAVVNIDTAEYYVWRVGFYGWQLVRFERLSVI